MSKGRVAGHQWQRRTCFQLKGSSSYGVDAWVWGRRVLRGGATGGHGAVRVGGALSQAERSGRSAGLVLLDANHVDIARLAAGVACLLLFLCERRGVHVSS